MAQQDYRENGQNGRIVEPEMQVTHNIEGMRGGSQAHVERGREDEHSGRGERGRNDLDDRSSVGGRHYGRSGAEEPGPGYGRGELQERHLREGWREPSYGGRMPRASEFGDIGTREGDGFAPGETLSRGHSQQQQQQQQGRTTTTSRRRWRGGAQKVRDVMTRNPRTCSPDEAIERVAQLMVDEDTGIVPVVEDGRLVGVVTDRDIVCRLVGRGIDMKGARVRDVMTDEVECATEGESVGEVLRVMGDHQIRRMPVVARGDRLVGIVSLGDIAREADADDDLQRTFEEISSGRGFWSSLR